MSNLQLLGHMPMLGELTVAVKSRSGKANNISNQSFSEWKRKQVSCLSGLLPVLVDLGSNFFFLAVGMASE